MNEMDFFSFEKLCNLLKKKAMSAMFVNWAPSLEKSSLIGFAAAGSWLGNVVALPLGK